MVGWKIFVRIWFGLRIFGLNLVVRWKSWKFRLRLFVVIMCWMNNWFSVSKYCGCFGSVKWRVSGSVLFLKLNVLWLNWRCKVLFCVKLKCGLRKCGKYILLLVMCCIGCRVICIWLMLKWCVWKWKFVIVVNCVINWKFVLFSWKVNWFSGV